LRRAATYNQSPFYQLDERSIHRIDLYTHIKKLGIFADIQRVKKSVVQVFDSYLVGVYAEFFFFSTGFRSLELNDTMTLK
jgi:hypothetical protein